MKKNEIIQLIADTMFPCNASYKKNREDKAKEVLEVIEKAGMLPSMTDKQERDDQIVSDLNCSQYYTHPDDLEWEPEDES